MEIAQGKVSFNTFYSNRSNVAKDIRSDTSTETVETARWSRT